MNGRISLNKLNDLQLPRYLVMALHSWLLHLHCSHAHWCLYPSAQIPSNCDHNHAILLIKTLAIRRLWVLLHRGLGNTTLRDLRRPFKKKTMSFRHSTENMCIWPKAWRGTLQSLEDHCYPLMALNWQRSKRSYQGWKSPFEINCLISISSLSSDDVCNIGHMLNLFPIKPAQKKSFQTWD